MNPKGKIKIFIGCMFAEKTSHMLSEVEKYGIAKKNCVVVKHSIDTRFDGISTHSKRKYHHFRELTSSSIGDIYDELCNYDVIGIDEIQFFEDAVKNVIALANKGKVVILSGLSGDYKDDPFPIVSNLIPVAESVIKLHAVCMRCCNRSAIFSVKLVEKDGIEIGGTDKYQVLCRKCKYNL